MRPRESRFCLSSYFSSPLFSLRKRRQASSHSIPRAKRPRTNEEIRAAHVLLVTDGGAEVLSVEDALQRAKGMEMDLIEVSPKADPPVVKIGDVGQHMYQVNKKEKKQRAHNKQTEVKTLRFGFRTDRHDLQRLMDRSKEFFAERHLVKFIVRLRGRELTNKSYAEEKLRSVVGGLQDVAEVEQEIKKQGNQFIVILRAKKK
ncbi:MAG TPA: translation initiation factor IF-3 [Candidatus Peribacteraceae bacterium]|nr:translation initiation factor IF-3 [Candidatus Peribacteraceae bacterium]